MKLTNQGKWLISSMLLSIATVLFVIAWTAPFWPPWFSWLGLPLTKTLFPIAVMLVFIFLFLYSLKLLSRTDAPPTKVGQTDK